MKKRGGKQMAKDDYYVIVYQILAYLYVCLKNGENVEANKLKPNGDMFAINEKYWTYIMENMVDQGFIRGIAIKKGAHDTYIGGLEHCEITPVGIDYLCDNSRLKKAFEFAKDVMAITPLNLF